MLRISSPPNDVVVHDQATWDSFDELMKQRCIQSMGGQRALVVWLVKRGEEFVHVRLPRPSDQIIAHTARSEAGVPCCGLP